MSRSTLSTGDMAFITSSHTETTANLGRVVTVLRRACPPANYVASDGTKLFIAPTDEPLWWVKSDRPLACWAMIDKRVVWCYERPIVRSALTKINGIESSECVAKSEFA